MRFLVSRDVRLNPQLRLILTAYLIGLFVFLLFSFHSELTKFGLFPKQITDAVLGNKDLFQEPMTLEALIDETHIRLFLYSLSTLTAFSILAVSEMSPLVQMTLALGSMLCVLVDSGSLFAIRYMGPMFSYFKTMAFFGQQASLIFVTAYALRFLAKDPA